MHAIHARARALRRALQAGLALAAALLVSACAGSPPESTPPPEGRYTASLLWQVEKEGMAPGFVLGTMHSADPRLRDLRPEVRRALDDSTIVAFELLRSEQGDAVLMSAMVQPEGRRLEDVIGPDLFQRTAAAASDFGLTPAHLQRMTPLALVPFLAYPPRELTRLLRGETVFDDWLQHEARRQGKDLHGLESYQEQISLFSDLSDAEQVALVSDLLVDHAEAHATFDRLFQAYLAGDIDAIMRDARDGSRASDPEAAERFIERLLDDRNHTMVQRMVPLMQQGATFVAVGAAHLGGEAGILRLLEQRGYRVTRVH